VKNRNYYFKKVKEVWTASRKHSKMRGKNLEFLKTSIPVSAKHLANPHVIMDPIVKTIICLA